MKIERQYRQGDVLLHPVSGIPEGAMKEETKGSVVLAEGEATGHAHRIQTGRKKVIPYKRGEELYLEVRQPVTVEHEEHAPLTLEPGFYQVRRQVESWMDEARQVRD